MATSFRSLFKWLVPSWLSTGEGEIVLHSLALIKDAFSARVRHGLNARFPTRSGPSALALTGSDRGIIQGRSEIDAHYAARLIAWRYPRGHRVRGSAWALLEQMGEYYGGIHCYTVDASGNVFDRTNDGVESYTTQAPWTWGTDPGWARFWVVLDPGADFPMGEQPDLGDPDLWGGELGLPGFTLGQTGALPEDVVALRRLMRGRAWKPAGSRAEWFLVSLDGTVPAPDATWTRWSKNVAGVQVPARRQAGIRFWSFDPRYNNSPPGDPTNFPDAVRMLDGTDGGGDPASFPLTVTLPSGRVYGGNPAKFPARVQLLDDGDAPR